MIEKISGINIQGKCFKSETSLMFYQHPHDRISIVYGKNGSGKSTISEGIASITTGYSSSNLSASLIDLNQQVLSVGNEERIFVFNEKYIDNNVKIDDDALGTIVLLGNQVGLQSEIDSQEGIVNSLSDKVDKISKECLDYYNKNNPLCPDFHKNRIINTLKQDGGWADEDSHIKGKKTKSHVTDAIIKEIGDMKVGESIEELNKRKNELQILLRKASDNSISYPKEVKTIEIDPNFETLIVNLLSIIIEEPVMTEREKLILNEIEKGNQSYVEKARIDFSDEETKYCPYCYQPVTEHYKDRLINSINKVLNKDVDEHKNQLKSILFPHITLDLSYLQSLDSELSSEAFKCMEICNVLIREYQELVLQKEGNIYTPIVIEANGLIKEIKNLNFILQQLEEKRIEFNEASKKKKSIINNLTYINKAIAHIQTAQLYKDLNKQEKAQTALQKRLNDNKNLLCHEKEKLTELLHRKSNIGLAINRINNLLDYVFLAHNRLSIELINEKYYLKSNGESVLPKDVSLGERNIIALCYFFTQILSNQEIEKIYQSETMIVIDDPISSFDFENKIGIVSLLRYQADRIINGNYNSKILFLSHDLETVFALRKAMEEICQSTKGIAGIPKTSSISLELFNSTLIQLNKHHNEYGNLLKRVYHFANGEKREESLSVGNEMRRILEAYSTFLYQKSIEQVSCDSNVLEALGKYSVFYNNLMYRLVLHGESHYEEQVYSVRDDNNFFQFISYDERIKTAKYILCFMYILSPHHIISYLKTESGAIDNIKRWLKDIPDNHSFEIESKSEKRIIPLYYLPLSAGIGNEVFEGISSDEYETDNETCDYALRVSGNSMEPNIPNGSIVLIKEQKTIEDNQIGAFYFNGKVYCKFIKHENGKAYLCSCNDDYPPIIISDDDTLTVYGRVIKVVSEID